MKVWDEISGACERDELIEGTISARVKGGLSVTIRGGVKAFLPGSQVDLRPVRNLDKLIGQTYQFKVIKFNKKRGNIVLSRRVLLEKERDELKEKTLEKLKEGKIVDGIIKNLTEYGAFVDLGGIDGLLHITDMSLGPRQRTRPSCSRSATRSRVKVLKFNAETERVSLGLKQMQEDPWNHAAGEVPARHARARQGHVAHGLRRVRRARAGHRGPHPRQRDVAGPSGSSTRRRCWRSATRSRPWCSTSTRGQKRISLGMKQLEPNPFASLTEKYPPGTVVKGKVRNITDFGVFVGIEEGVDGLVHNTDLSWTQRVKHPSELYQKGDEVEAIILNIDFDDEKPRSRSASSSWCPIRGIASPTTTRSGKHRRGQGHQGRSTSAPSWRSRRASRASSTSRSSPRSASRTRRRSSSPARP